MALCYHTFSGGGWGGGDRDVQELQLMVLSSHQVEGLIRQEEAAVGLGPLAGLS